LDKNSINKVIKEVKKAINEASIGERTKKLFMPSGEISLRIYGLPKIHKEGIPIRPIVNMIVSHTYEITNYVARLFKPLVGTTNSIKDSKGFVNLIKNERVNSQDNLVSIEVVSLFTKISLDKTV
jgi:hypothetical protein